MRGFVTIPLFLGLLLCACSGSDGSEPTSVPATLTLTPTPGIEAIATQEFVMVPSPTTAVEPVGPVVAILPNNAPDSLLLYDVGLGQVLLNLALPAVDGRYRGDARAEHIVVAAESTVSEVGLDGSLREIYRVPDDSYRLGDVAISPDGATAAVTMERWPGPGTPSPTDGSYVLLLDLSSGDEMLSIMKPFSPQAGDEFADFIGLFSWLVWRNDGAGVVVSGSTNSERPGGWATLYSDGRVVQHELIDYGSIAPSGRVASHGKVSVRCMAVASDRLDIRDLDIDANVASVRADDGYVLTAWDWSPDSSELLVASSPLLEPASPADGSGPCPDFESPDWLVVDVTSGASRPVDDLSALYRRWYADQPLIAMDCSGSMEYLDYSRWAERSISCRDAGDHPLLIDAKEIARGRQFQVIGIIDVKP